MKLFNVNDEAVERTSTYGIRKIAAVVAVLAAMLATLLITAGSATASASGCSYFGGGWSSGYPFYNGSYCVTLSGSGTYVNYVSGGWSAYGTVCNYSETAEFFDSSGRWYMTYNGGTHYGCGHSGGYAIGIYRYVRPGFMCSTLKQNGARLTSVCHNIY